MKIAISGVGKMGAQIVQKLIEGGHVVVAHDRDLAAVTKTEEYGALPASSPQEVVTLFDAQPVMLWLMIPSQYVDGALDEWLEVLPAGSVIVDGGNSDYRLDTARADRARQVGVGFMDVGTSGGVWGYENGFSMMAGGDRASYEQIIPVLDTLAHPHGGHNFFGTNGAGHYVKMVHNAIEYGMMQSYAEGYRMLVEGPFKDVDTAAAGKVWQQSSVIASWLNGITANVLAKNPMLDGIDGVVAESGEARWTLETAHELGVDMPAVQASFDVRLRSQKGETNYATKLIAAMRHEFGGHDINAK